MIQVLDVPSIREILNHPLEPQYSFLLPVENGGMRGMILSLPCQEPSQDVVVSSKVSVRTDNGNRQPTDC